MSYSTPHIVPAPDRTRPAWGASIVFHLTAIALLAFMVRSIPRGVAEGNGHSIGLILNAKSADGDSLEGGEGNDSPVSTLQESPVPPPLLPTPPPVIAEVEDTRTELQAAPVKLASTIPQAASVAPATAAPVRNVPSQPGTGGHGQGRGGTPGGHGDATVSVFGVQGKGTKFVYLFDRSASMEGPPLAAAKRQLLQSLQSLGSIHQFHIIFFNTKTQPFINPSGTLRDAFATDRNKQLAANFVGGITADGGTDRMAALRAAIGCSPDVIFFLSDADDPMSASELAELARLNRHSQATICVIEFGRSSTPSPNNFLMQLAHTSGGQYGYVDTTTLSLTH
jgi:hypothetical protein